MTDLAAFFAHPDDAELVVGGTLAREAARGRRVAMVDLTRGESGSRGTPETRAKEAAAAAAILGVAHRESLGLPDSALTPIPEQRDIVVAALRRLKPRVVICQHWEQRHPDHAVAGRLVHDACFMAGLRNYRPDLGEAFRPFKLLYALSTTEVYELAPSFIVDVTAFWETKMKAVQAFASQFVSAPGENIELPFKHFRENAELAGRRYGAKVGVLFGEAYVTKEPMLVDDVASLPVRSI